MLVRISCTFGKPLCSVLLLFRILVLLLLWLISDFSTVCMLVTVDDSCRWPDLRFLAVFDGDLVNECWRSLDGGATEIRGFLFVALLLLVTLTGEICGDNIICFTAEV